MIVLVFLLSIAALLVALNARQQTSKLRAENLQLRAAVDALARKVWRADEPLPVSSLPVASEPEPVVEPEPATVNWQPATEPEPIAAFEATPEPEPVAPPPPPVAPAKPPKPPFDWESIIGVKLFSWIAGIALVLAALFFLRYSVEHGWLSAPVRAVIGIAVGAALVAICELKVARSYKFTANAMHGAGIAILYSTLFAIYALWQRYQVEPITRDHSLVKRLEELGHITPEEAANYPHRNVLYRALGQGEILDADIFTLVFPQPGYLMICSDGLWNVVTEQDIVVAINEAPNLQRACQNLVNAANSAGGPDNISVIMAQLIG